MKRNHLLNLLLLYILMIVLIIGCSVLFSSCQVLKGKSLTVKDSTAVAKKDSGKVVKNESSKKDSSAWWREIINFGRDTTIYSNTTTVPVNNYYPTQIVREGGTQKTETKQINYDSIWNNKMDSLAYKFANTSKTKETKVLGFWQILAIAAGVGLVFFLIGKLKIGIK